ncbi:MAG: helix-turn-helix domain-containing protein [Acidimicrobiales bacterium]
MLPAGWFGACPQMRDALAGYDFGTAFRMIRAETGLSQQKLGELIGFEQRRVSEIERGLRNLRDIRLVAQVTTRLGIPPVMLGFGTPATVGHAGAINWQRGSWMDRRNFVGQVAGIVMGMTAAGGVDVGRLTALLPQAEPTGTRHVGVDDVAAIEQSAQAFSRVDFAQGSAFSRDAAVSHLQSVLPLLNAQMTPQVRPRLHIATGYLAMMAGWMSFEVRQHDAARQLWTIGLDVAHNTDDPQSADLSAFLLYDMALQAV